MIEALLGFLVGDGDYATFAATPAHLASATVEEMPNGKELCRWAGVTVGPMTAAFSESLGMAERDSPILNLPEPGGRAAAAALDRATG